MNNYCPVNSSTQVAGQFPSQAYLFVYKICKASGRSVSPWRPSIQVIGHQDMKQMFIGQQILLVAPLSVLQESSPFCFWVFKRGEESSIKDVRKKTRFSTLPQSAFDQRPPLADVRISHYTLPYRLAV